MCVRACVYLYDLQELCHCYCGTLVLGFRQDWDAGAQCAPQGSEPQGCFCLRHTSRPCIWRLIQQACSCRSSNGSSSISSSSILVKQPSLCHAQYPSHADISVACTLLCLQQISMCVDGSYAKLVTEHATGLSQRPKVAVYVGGSYAKLVTEHATGLSQQPKVAMCITHELCQRTRATHSCLPAWPGHWT